jgi:hypothetical protein
LDRKKKDKEEKMPKLFASSLSIILLMMAAVPASWSQDARPGEYPADINRYEFLRYSGGQEALSVDAVVRADNNWSILLACLGGKTREELRAMGLDVTESQLMLLSAMRFVEVKKETGPEKIVTTLPILGVKKKQALIQRVRAVAREVEAALREDLSALVKTLKDAGYEDRAFSILFSAVVDGLVWFPLRDQGFVTEFALTPQRPLFDGIFWAYSPKRDFRCGTNIALGQDVYVVLNWSDGPREKIQQAFNWTNLHLLHDDLVQHGRVVHEVLKRELAPYGIFDETGRLTIPVIKMKADDPLFPKCQSLAGKIVTSIGQKLNPDILKEEFGFADKEQAFVVAYHEWMWEFMGYLEERGVLQKPLAFADPGAARPKDIGRLLFVVIG